MAKGRVLHCSNDLVEAYKLYSPIQLRAFYNLLYLYKFKDLKPDYADYDEYEISIDEIASYLGKKHLTLSEIKEFIETLPSQINFKDKIGYISVFKRIFYNEQDESIVYVVNDDLIPYIKDLKDKFAILELEDLSNLSSKYSQRLYEFICKNKNLGKYLMRIDDFREYFYVPNDYKMSNIDQRIINPIQKEINNKTEFDVDIKKVKKRNKVTHIEFIIKEK